MALASGGRFTEAEKAGIESLNLEETPDALNLLGTLLAYQGRDQDSLPYFQRALKWWPDRSLVWMNLGTAFRRLGLSNDARAAYARSRELAETGVTKNPRSGYLRSLIAYTSAWLGEPRRAENEITQAVQLSPEDTNVLRMAVKTYEALGRRQESIGILTRLPAEVRSDLARYPDLADLHRDSRFQSLMPQLTDAETKRR